MHDQLRKVALEDGRYAPEAFQFLYEGLEFAIQAAGRSNLEGSERHVSGPEVLAGLEQCALRTFGPLASAVWRAWGIRRALDWGHIVFALVDAKLLRRQDSDALADFDVERDFERMFVTEYPLKLPNTL